MSVTVQGLQAPIEHRQPMHGFGQVGPVLRLAIAGTTQGPSIFAVMHLIGKEASERRILHAITTL